MTGDNNYAFRIKDPLGYEISCSQTRWKNYIETGHDELEGRIDHVKTTISQPDSIYLSASKENRYIACRSENSFIKPTVKVVVNIKDDKTGEVITAYTAMEERGDNIGAKIYPPSSI